MLARATEERDIKRAKRFSVRGLRRCQNEGCAVYHNRDYNAAYNIGVRLKTLLWPHLYHKGASPLINPRALAVLYLGMRDTTFVVRRCKRSLEARDVHFHPKIKK